MAILALIALIAGQLTVMAQPAPGNCADGRAYIVTYTIEDGGSLYYMGLNDAAPTQINFTDPASGEIAFNGIGYNNSDNLLYGLDQFTRKFYKIGVNGEVEEITLASALPTGTYTAGDVYNNVYYTWNRTSNRLYSINLTGTPTATLVYDMALNPPATAVTGTIDDFAVSPDGNIYGVTSTGDLFKFDPTNSVPENRISKIGTVGNNVPTGTKGTAFMDAAGNLYIGDNITGNIYNIGKPAGAGPWNPATPFSTAFSGKSPNDGARCPSLVPPSANPDTRTLINMNMQTLPVINGPGTGIGVDGEGTYGIDPTSIILTIPGTGSNLTNPQISNGGKTLTAVEGTFQVHPTNGTVSFTPAINFNKSIVVNYTIKDTEGNVSNPTTITITADGTLPVDFGAVSAVFVNGQLVVNWSTLSESGNSHFDIEISKDGTNFTKIGSVDSKADKNGNSDAPIDYDFSINLQNGNTLLGIALFSIAFIALLFSRKNKWLYTVVLVGGLSIFGASSCSKDDAAGVEDTGKAFVRIKQVDKDGKFTYSKPVQVVKK